MIVLQIIFMENIGSYFYALKIDNVLKNDLDLIRQYESDIAIVWGVQTGIFLLHIGLLVTYHTQKSGKTLWSMIVCC